jgi:hypothetical protein
MLRRLLVPLVIGLCLALPAAAGAAVVKLAPFRTEETPLSAKTALRKAEAVNDGRASVRGADLTPLLRVLAVKLPTLHGAERRRAEHLLARPTKGDTRSDEDHYTVAEHAPFCSARFCVHWVSSTSDAPPAQDSNANGIPDYVETVSATFEHVYDVENTQLGWRAPKSDGSRGCPDAAASCMNKTDVYLKNIGDQALYGFASADPNQDTFGQHAYLVLDNDFAEDVFSRYASPLEPIEVTAAHEYNHVLQFSYDVEMNTWMFEASSTWMEDVVYSDINDYLQYIPSWAGLSFLPLTNEEGSTDEFTGKTYGNMVWNEFLERTYGIDTIRKAWEQALKSKPVRSFAPGAYDRALNEKHSGFFKAFARFAASTAEWRSANSVFPDRGLYPDVDRGQSVRGRIVHLVANGATVGAQISHTGYGLVDVRRTSAPRIKLVAAAPRGVRVAVALVGRTGSATTGTSTVALKLMKGGGSATVTLDDPGRFTRITAVLINADARTTARSENDRFVNGDWPWLADDVPIGAGISTDFTAPGITRRTPAPGRTGVSRRSPVKVTFSEAVGGVRTTTARVLDSKGRAVSAKVSFSKGRSLVIRPRKVLRSHKRYTVSLSPVIKDNGGNRLPVASRSWSFTTAR